MTVPKPVSERDFLNLTKKLPYVKKTADNAESLGNTSNKDNISNTSNPGNKGNTGNSVELKRAITAPAVVRAAVDRVRQTFVVGRGHLERLWDYVHTRQSQGDYIYSQKQGCC